MANDEFIKKLASLINEDGEFDFHDADLFGNKIESPSQVVSQVFMHGWDFGQSLEVALATIDSLWRAHERGHDPIPPDAIEMAKQLVRSQYAKWQQAGHVILGD